jgi:lipopolysaccharide export LptBFGC system permease protein LptF
MAAALASLAMAGILVNGSCRAPHSNQEALKIRAQTKNSLAIEA